MAKKRKQKEEEKERPIFVPPVFDEKEYMGNEIKNSKVAILVFLYAVGFASISILLTHADQLGLALFAGLIGILIMTKVFEKVKLDLSHLAKKDWIGNYVMFFFAWLGIWLLLCNPPFADFSHPDVDDIRISLYDEEKDVWVASYYLYHDSDEHLSTWVDRTDENASYLLHANTPFNLTFQVTDNVGLESVVLDIYSNNGNRTPVLNKTGNEWYVVLNFSAPGDYYLKLFTEDVNGNKLDMSQDWYGNSLKFTVWP